MKDIVIKKYYKISLVLLIIFSVTYFSLGIVGNSKASTLQPADINNDNKVDIFDLSILLSNWNKSGTSTSDLNNDSIVNIFDLSMLLSKWGPVAVVTPTVTPTPGDQTCSNFPAFPDANCTGVPAGTTLTPSGSITVTTPNTVIQNLDITGQVLIKASNVTIKNCIIHGGDFYSVQVLSGNVTILDSELYGATEAAIAFDNWKGYRLDIHSMPADGVKFGSNTTLEDSYLHDFTTLAGAHADGGQMQSGESNVIIRHNYINITGPSPNAALMMAPDLGPNSNGPIVIDKNLFGSGNYTVVIVDGNNGQYHQSGYTFTNNHFLRNFQYGPTNINEPAGNFTSWSGNVYHDNNAVIGL